MRQNGDGLTLDVCYNVQTAVGVKKCVKSKSYNGFGK